VDLKEEVIHIMSLIRKVFDVLARLIMHPFLLNHGDISHLDDTLELKEFLFAELFIVRSSALGAKEDNVILNEELSADEAFSSAVVDVLPKFSFMSLSEELQELALDGRDRSLCIQD